MRHAASRWLLSTLLGALGVGPGLAQAQEPAKDPAHDRVPDRAEDLRVPARQALAGPSSLTLAMSTAGAASAAEGAPAESASAETEQAFRPPVTGLPRTVGGAVRGFEPGSPELAVVAPPTAAWSATAQPTLYWFLSAPTLAHLELVVMEETSERPLVQRPLPPPERDGLQAIALAELGVRLEPGRDYEWTIAVVTDPEHPSRDVVAGGALRYQPPAPALSERLRTGQPAEEPALYAANGYWYDAVHLLAQALAAGGAQRGEAGQRLARLLREGELPEVARVIAP